MIKLKKEKIKKKRNLLKEMGISKKKMIKRIKKKLRRKIKRSIKKLR